MGAKPAFAEFEATLEANDDQLQKDLRKAEETVKRSAGKMQKSLDGLTASAGSLGPALGTLSQVGASVGGSFGGIVGQSVAATQAIAGMTTVVAGPAGIVVALAALTVGVFAYREEAAAWLNSMLVSIGVLEDLDAALAASESRNRTAEQTLDRQVKSQERLNQELRQGISLKTAQQTNNPAFIAETQRQIALEKRIAQELAAGGSAKSVETLRSISRVNEDIASSKARQLAFDKERDRLGREDLERQKRIEQLISSRAATAQGLLVQLGGASPSDFIDDPVLKRLALLQELAASRAAAASRGVPTPGRSGTIGFSQIQSPLAIVRGGEVIGQQTLTVQEEIKRETVNQSDVIRQIRDILRTATTGGNVGSAGSAFVVTRNP